MQSAPKLQPVKAVCQGLPDAGVWLAVEALGNVDGATAIGWNAHIFALLVGQLCSCMSQTNRGVSHDEPARFTLFFSSTACQMVR